MITSDTTSYLAIILTDDMIQRRLLAALMPKSFDVKKTGVSHEAIYALKSSNRKTLAFLDVRSLEDDGAQLSQLLKNSFHNMAIVLFSGLSQQSKLNNLVKNTVAEHYLLLPFDHSKLEDILSDFQNAIEQSSNKTSSANASNLMNTGKKKNALQIPQAKIKPGSILKKLDKNYKGIFDGIWQETDQFLPK